MSGVLNAFVDITTVAKRIDYQYAHSPFMASSTLYVISATADQFGQRGLFLWNVSVACFSWDCILAVSNGPTLTIECCRCNMWGNSVHGMICKPNLKLTMVTIWMVPDAMKKHILVVCNVTVIHPCLTD